MSTQQPSDTEYIRHQMGNRRCMLIKGSDDYDRVWTCKDSQFANDEKSSCRSRSRHCYVSMRVSNVSSHMIDYFPERATLALMDGDCFG